MGRGSNYWRTCEQPAATLKLMAGSRKKPVQLPVVQLLERVGKVSRQHVSRRQFFNADIMYALRKYVHATGDEAFLRNFRAEMLVETARLWLDLGFYSDAKGGKFCINGVTGPDEYNAVVNNNAYTNLMARENLRYAAEVVESLRATEPDAYNTLVHKTVLEPSEVKAWIRA